MIKTDLKSLVYKGVEYQLDKTDGGTYKIAEGIDAKTFKTNVIAIGVATVVEASNIIYQVLEHNNIEKDRQIKEFLNQSEYQLVVTPKDIDEDIMHLSEIISASINKAINKNFISF